MRVAGPVLLVLGLICLVVSFAWASIAAPMTQVTTEEAAEYGQVVSDMHGPPGRISEAERKQKLDRMLEIQREADRSRQIERLGQIGWRVAGIALAVAGAGLHFWAASKDD
jgi:hypothetical protein